MMTKRAKMALFNEGAVIQALKVAQAVDDPVALSRALGEFERLPPNEAAHMIAASLMFRLRKALDEVQDVNQCSRAEARDSIVAMVDWLARDEPTR